MYNAIINCDVTFQKNNATIGFIPLSNPSRAKFWNWLYWLLGILYYTILLYVYCYYYIILIYDIDMAYYISIGYIGFLNDNTNIESCHPTFRVY